MMQFEKRCICDLKSPYALGTIVQNGERCVVGSTEDHGPIMLMRPPFREAAQMVEGPGGCMSLVADSKRLGDLYAIMECFVPYKFQAGGIYHIRSGTGDVTWSAAKIINLAFVHRIDFLDRGGTRFLLAATLATDKTDPADWSSPGSLYASRVPGGSGERWELIPILEGIHRNHGLLVTRFMGRRSVLVSGTEGLFAADVETGNTEWVFRQVLGDPISEIAVFDVDGDGSDELITIEPFHGNYLRIYRQVSNGWQKAWESELEFGHCLLAGLFDRVPSILVSNRAGSRDLLLYRFERPTKQKTQQLPQPIRIVIDAGVGAANMLVLSHEGADLIFAANQTAGEIVAYASH